jgi:hypothetical protein
MHGLVALNVELNELDVELQRKEENKLKVMHKQKQMH